MPLFFLCWVNSLRYIDAIMTGVPFSIADIDDKSSRRGSFAAEDLHVDSMCIFNFYIQFEGGSAILKRRGQQAVVYSTEVSGNAAHDALVKCMLLVNKMSFPDLHSIDPVYHMIFFCHN